MEVVRPEKIYKALLYLKENNPFYRNVELLPYDDFLEECKNDGADSQPGEFNQIDDKDESTDDEAEDKVEDETDCVFTNVTCLVPEDLSTEVIVNTSKETIKKKVSRKSNTVYEVAPGENKRPNNWTMEEYFEELCFANLLPDLDQNPFARSNVFIDQRENANL